MTLPIKSQSTGPSQPLTSTQGTTEVPPHLTVIGRKAGEKVRGGLTQLSQSLSGAGSQESPGETKSPGEGPSTPTTRPESSSEAPKLEFPPEIKQTQSDAKVGQLILKTVDAFQDKIKQARSDQPTDKQARRETYLKIANEALRDAKTPEEKLVIYINTPKTVRGKLLKANKPAIHGALKEVVAKFNQSPSETTFLTLIWFGKDSEGRANAVLKNLASNDMKDLYTQKLTEFRQIASGERSGAKEAPPRTQGPAKTSGPAHQQKVTIESSGAGTISVRSPSTSSTPQVQSHPSSPPTFRLVPTGSKNVDKAFSKIFEKFQSIDPSDSKSVESHYPKLSKAGLKAAKSRLSKFIGKPPEKWNPSDVKQFQAALENITQFPARSMATDRKFIKGMTALFEKAFAKLDNSSQSETLYTALLTFHAKTHVPPENAFQTLQSTISETLRNTGEARLALAQFSISESEELSIVGFTPERMSAFATDHPEISWSGTIHSTLKDFGAIDSNNMPDPKFSRTLKESSAYLNTFLELIESDQPISENSKITGAYLNEEGETRWSETVNTAILLGKLTGYDFEGWPGDLSSPLPPSESSTAEGTSGVINYEDHLPALVKHLKTQPEAVTRLIKDVLMRPLAMESSDPNSNAPEMFSSLSVLESGMKSRSPEIKQGFKDAKLTLFTQASIPTREVNTTPNTAKGLGPLVEFGKLQSRQSTKFSTLSTLLTENWDQIAENLTPEELSAAQSLKNFSDLYSQSYDGVTALQTQPFQPKDLELIGVVFDKKHAKLSPEDASTLFNYLQTKGFIGEDGRLGPNFPESFVGFLQVFNDLPEPLSGQLKGKGLEGILFNQLNNWSHPTSTDFGVSPSDFSSLGLETGQTETLFNSLADQGFIEEDGRMNIGKLRKLTDKEKGVKLPAGLEPLTVQQLDQFFSTLVQDRVTTQMTALEGPLSMWDITNPNNVDGLQGFYTCSKDVGAMLTLGQKLMTVLAPQISKSGLQPNFFTGIHNEVLKAAQTQNLALGEYGNLSQFQPLSNILTRLNLV